MATEIQNAVGGLDNINKVEWCATRLRLVLKDVAKADAAAAKKAGAVGTMRVGSNGFQVVIGLNAELVGNKMLAHKNAETSNETKGPPLPAPAKTKAK